jgi:hypothetical protein
VTPWLDAVELCSGELFDAVGVAVDVMAGVGLAPVSRLENEQEVKVRVISRVHKALREDMFTA